MAVGRKSERGLYAGDVRAGLRDGLVELGLPAAGDKNVGTLFNEPLLSPSLSLRDEQVTAS